MRLTATSWPEVAFVRGLLIDPQRTTLGTEGDILWTGARNAAGYPYVRYEGRMVGAHRLVYRVLVADLAPGEPVHHRCAFRSCIRPDHLERATHATNSLEMLARRGYEARLSRMDAILVDIASELRDGTEDLLDRLARSEDRARELSSALAAIDPDHHALSLN